MKNLEKCEKGKKLEYFLEEISNCNNLDELRNLYSLCNLCLQEYIYSNAMRIKENKEESKC